MKSIHIIFIKKSGGGGYVGQQLFSGSAFLPSKWLRSILMDLGVFQKGGSNWHVTVPTGPCLQWERIFFQSTSFLSFYTFVVVNQELRLLKREYAFRFGITVDCCLFSLFKKFTEIFTKKLGNFRDQFQIKKLSFNNQSCQIFQKGT